MGCELVARCWIEAGLTAGALNPHYPMPYTVTILSTDGNTNTYSCEGSSDAEARTSTIEIVKEKADRDDPGATVTIELDGEKIGPASTVRDMVAKAD